jgi:subtilisin family serine protease
MVEDIIEDKKVYASLFESTQSIGATDTWNIQLNNQNLTGLGQTVCIIDTGIDYTHPDFGGCEGIYESDEMVLETPITSPNYPNNYSNNFDDYVGIISMPGYDFIQIYFDSLYTEIGYDWVYFYNSTYDLIGGYSGGGESLEFWSTDLPYDTIYVKFLSDEDINYTSFNITKVRGYNSTSSHICDKVIGGYDFYNDDPNPMDDEGHGTHVAGIIAANGSIKGVAPDAKIVAIKALGNDGGWNADIISGIEYCTNHADEYNITVISMSLGGEELYDNYCDSDNSLMATAINNAVAKNISVVVATGNNGSLTKISSPACIQNATRVGSSLKSIDELSSFSKVGS